jgi:hypothetical protein
MGGEGYRNVRGELRRLIKRAADRGRRIRYCEGHVVGGHLFVELLHRGAVSLNFTAVIFSNTAAGMPLSYRTAVLTDG